MRGPWPAALLPLLLPASPAELNIHINMSESERAAVRNTTVTAVTRVGNTTEQELAADCGNKAGHCITHTAIWYYRYLGQLHNTNHLQIGE